MSESNNSLFDRKQREFSITVGVALTDIVWQINTDKAIAATTP